MIFSVYAIDQGARLTDQIEFSYNYTDEKFEWELTSYQLVERFKWYKMIYSPTDPNIIYNEDTSNLIYYEDNKYTQELGVEDLDTLLRKGYYRLCVVLDNEDIYCNKEVLHILYDKRQIETNIGNWKFNISTIDDKIVIDWAKSNIPTDVIYNLYYSDNPEMNNKKTINYKKNLHEERYELGIDIIVTILEKIESEGKEKIYVNFCMDSNGPKCSDIWSITTRKAKILLGKKNETPQENTINNKINSDNTKEDGQIDDVFDIDSLIENNINTDQDNFEIERQLQANITDSIIFPKELLFFVIAIVIIVVTTVFFLDKLKGEIFAKKKMNIGQEITKMNKNNIIKKSEKTYINNINKLYQKIKETSYIVSPIFLANLLISLKSRGLVIILGGNGIGKTALVENLVIGLYQNNANKHILKIVIKESTNSSKKFIGMYDRLNNNYVDPYGLTKFINKAYSDLKNPYFLLMDEINSQDIEKFFPDILDIDTILNQGTSNFIKVGEISDADEESLKKRKIELIKEYNFLVEENDGIHYFGYKIPKNLYIIGTANIDKFTEPFSGKILDRSDIIKMSYMGDKNYDKEEERTLNLNIDIVRDSKILGKETISLELLKFIEKIKEIWPISKRTEKSLMYYQILIDKIEILSLSFAIQQKILPLTFGDKYKKPLQDLIKLCHKYNKQIDLEIAIKDIEKLLNEEFINYWKMT